METAKKRTKRKQTNILDQRLVLLPPSRMFDVPPSGWLKAIRGALGMSIELLARRLNIGTPSVFRMEQREVLGTITLESLERVARAMNCRLIYAIVPDEKYKSLDDILEQRALKAARKLVYDVEHSMKLEGQGDDSQENLEDEVKRLAQELKAKFSPLLWED